MTVRFKETPNVIDNAAERPLSSPVATLPAREPRLQQHGAPAAFVRRVPSGGPGSGSARAARGGASSAAAVALGRSAPASDAGSSSSRGSSFQPPWQPPSLTGKEELNALLQMQPASLPPSLPSSPQQPSSLRLEPVHPVAHPVKANALERAIPRRSAAVSSASSRAAVVGEVRGLHKAGPALPQQEADLAYRQDRLLSGMTDLLRCADEAALTDRYSPAGAFLAVNSTNRLRKLDEVLKRRLHSLRFLAEQQGRLGDRLERQEAARLPDQQQEVSKMRKQLDAKEAKLASRAKSLAEAQARLADAEQRCVHEAQARQADLRARQDEIDECVAAAREVNTALAQQEQTSRELQESMASMDKQAEQLRQDAVALEELRQEVDVREVSLRCVEAAWEKAMPPGNIGANNDAPDADTLLPAFADSLASTLLRNDAYLRRVRILVAGVVRRTTQARVATESASAARGSGAAVAFSPGGREEEEPLSVVSTADLGEGVDEEEGELHGSLQWEASASVESGYCSEGGVAAAGGPGAAQLLGDEDLLGHTDEASDTPESEAADGDCLEPVRAVQRMLTPGDARQRPALSPRPGSRWTPASPPPPAEGFPMPTLSLAKAKTTYGFATPGVANYAVTPAAPPPRRTASAPPETPRRLLSSVAVATAQRQVSSVKIPAVTPSAPGAANAVVLTSAGAAKTPSTPAMRGVTPRSSPPRSPREGPMPRWMQAGLLWRSTAGPLIQGGNSVSAAATPHVGGAGERTPMSPSLRRDRQETMTDALHAGPMLPAGVPLIGGPKGDKASLSPTFGQRVGSSVRVPSCGLASYTPTPAAPAPWASPRTHPGQSPSPIMGTRGRLGGGLDAVSISTAATNFHNSVGVGSASLAPASRVITPSGSTPGSVSIGGGMAASTPGRRAVPPLAQSPRLTATTGSLPDALLASAPFTGQRATIAPSSAFSGGLNSSSFLAPSVSTTQAPASLTMIAGALSAAVPRTVAAQPRRVLVPGGLNTS